MSLSENQTENSKEKQEETYKNLLLTKVSTTTIQRGC